MNYILESHDWQGHADSSVTDLNNVIRSTVWTTLNILGALKFRLHLRTAQCVSIFKTDPRVGSKKAKG